MLLYMNFMITKNQNTIKDTHTHNRERDPNILLPKKELNTKDKNAENKKQKVYEAYRKEIAQ